MLIYSFFFFNDTATTEIYTLSLHDALPISLSFAINADSDTPPHIITKKVSPTITATDLVIRKNVPRSEEHTSELQSQSNLVCRLLLEKKKNIHNEASFNTHMSSINQHHTYS